MQQAIHTETIGKFTVSVYRDEYPGCPLTDFDLAGKAFVLWHYAKAFRHANDIEVIGRRGDYDEDVLQEVERELRKERSEFERFYLDGGCAGFLVINQETGRKEWGYFWRGHARECLKSQVEIMDNWAAGNVWGYSVEDECGDCVDSCWGYYGDYDDPYGALSEGVRAAQRRENERLKAAAKTLHARISLRGDIAGSGARNAKELLAQFNRLFYGK